MDQFDRMLAKWQPMALSLFRFITGLLLFQFGVAKILKFPVIPDGNAYVFLNKVQLNSLSGAAGLIGVSCIRLKKPLTLSSARFWPVSFGSCGARATCTRGRAAAACS